MNREYKSFHFEVKAVDDEQGLIEAYGSIFSLPDQGNDIVEPGAFKRTIQNNKSRVAAGKSNFLSMMLWNHDTEHFLPIGGWYDLTENEHGLLGKGKIAIDTQLGQDVYKLIKGGYIDEFSIGYDIPNMREECVTWDKSTGIRHLKELRLWEVSPVVFAMQDEALLVGVKSLETKTVCGNTSGPIGPRDEAWDGGKAKKQIWAACEKEDGSLNTTLAKKYFMSMSGDAQQKGSYSYPFWYVGDSPHICVGAVKAVAGAIQGSRGADAGSDSAGIKKKVETLYSRINAKYTSDPELVPPWKGKGRVMTLEKKTFAEHYAEEQAEDLLEDWQDVLLCALSCAVLDAFKIGDQPQQDVQEALAAFNEAAMKWVAQGIEYNLSGYLEDNSATYSSADSLMQYGSESKPNYGSYYGMASDRRIARKAGRAISASNSDKIQTHIDAMHSVADKMKEHTKSIRNAANDLATILQGSEPAYGTDPGTPAQGQQEGKAASPDEVRGAHTHPSLEDTVNEQELTAALDSLRSLHVVS